MRLRGTALSTSVQAERQGPSMTTRSPDCLTLAKKLRYSLTDPPPLDRMRTSESAGAVHAKKRASASERRGAASHLAGAGWEQFMAMAVIPRIHRKSWVPRPVYRPSAA
jgi:hypothetical protein